MFPSLYEEYNARILQRHHKIHFLHTIKKDKGVRLLDVGCGNQSASLIKSACPNVFYSGIDVGDYNQSQESKDLMDVYHVVAPDKFAGEIETFNGTQDIVISNHNLEHTNDPDACLRAMARALKKGGRLFMAFPSELSILFPSRGGTLNFYDDASHVNLLDFKHVCRVLKENGIKLEYANPSMRGWYLRKLGEREEGLSIAMNHVLVGTWDYWGFEAIIWGRKR